MCIQVHCVCTYVYTVDYVSFKITSADQLILLVGTPFRLNYGTNIDVILISLQYFLRKQVNT